MRLVKTLSDQLALAALEKPRRHFTRPQKLHYACPAARKGAEEDERARWFSKVGTDTEHATLLGGSKRAPTLLGPCQSSQEILGSVASLPDLL